MTLAERILQRYNQMCRKRDPWRSMFTLLAKYILLRTITFGDQNTGRIPKFSVKDVADDETIEVARSASTALGGALWPHAGESFELVPLPEEAQIAASIDLTLDDSQDQKVYWNKATRLLREKIDASDSGYLLAWAEYMDDQPVFGNSGIYGVEIEEDDAQPFQFRSVSVETSVIDEGPNGLIDTVYLEYQYTVRQLYDKFGEDISQVYKDKYNSGKCDDEMVRVIQAIEPRRGPDIKAGNEKEKKPVASVFVEVETKHVILNDGMDDMPIFFTRFRKRPNELYGRSLGMDALPTIKELNILRTAFTKALGKILDPPVGYYRELCGGVPDLSMGAKVPLQEGGRLPTGQKAVEPLITVPEPRIAHERLEAMVERVKAKFLVDRLLDFNNKQRMTLGEAELRNDFRNQALNNIFTRQIVELLVPLIRWAFMVMWRRRLIGLRPVEDAALISHLQSKGIEPLIIPQSVIDMMDRGKIPFAIRFISPAARAMKAESLMGIEKVSNYCFMLANAGMPEALDHLDTDQAVPMYSDLAGAPSTILRSPDQIKKKRKGRDAALLDQAQMQQAQMQAQTAAQGAKAIRDFSAAGNGK